MTNNGGRPNQVTQQATIAMTGKVDLAEINRRMKNTGVKPLAVGSSDRKVAGQIIQHDVVFTRRVGVSQDPLYGGHAAYGASDSRIDRRRIDNKIYGFASLNGAGVENHPLGFWDEFQIAGVALTPGQIESDGTSEMTDTFALTIFGMNNLQWRGINDVNVGDYIRVVIPKDQQQAQEHAVQGYMDPEGMPASERIVPALEAVNPSDLGFSRTLATNMRELDDYHSERGHPYSQTNAWEPRHESSRQLYAELRDGTVGNFYLGYILGRLLAPRGLGPNEQVDGVGLPDVASYRGGFDELVGRDYAAVIEEAQKIFKPQDARAQHLINTFFNMALALRQEDTKGLVPSPASELLVDTMKNAVPDQMFAASGFRMRAMREVIGRGMSAADAKSGKLVDALIMPHGTS